MCFKSGRKRHQETGAKSRVLKFHTTRLNVFVPICVSLGAFITEIYSVYYVSGESVDLLNIFRLFNTTFVPTHLATAVGFLCQHFSLSNYYNNSGKMRPLGEMDIKAEYAGFTMLSTIVLAFAYVLCCFKVSCINQLPLIFLQCSYMWILWKYIITDKVIVYNEPIESIVSY